VYSVRDYGQMILDDRRMGAYTRALRSVVRPGSTVLDLGAGTGFFAMLAKRMGARRVFAIETSDAVSLGRRMAAANGIDIEFYQGFSTEIQLPERADVIVSDLRGILPLYGRHAESLRDARERLLAPGGVLIPLSDALFAAVVHAPSQHALIGKAWNGDAYGLDLGIAREQVANTYWKASFKPDQVVAGPVACGTLDYSVLRNSDWACEVTFVAEGAAEAHGFGLWFDATLVEGIGFSNAPSASQLIYGQAYFPWPAAVPVSRGDRIELGLRADLVGDSYVWSWNTRVSAPGEAGARAQFAQSEFFGQMLAPETLRRQKATHVPRLGDEGRVDLRILTLMDDGKPLGEIARRIAEEFPTRFPRWQDALTRVGELGQRYEQ